MERNKLIRLMNFNLNMTDPVKRIIRRALAIGVLTALSVGITNYAQISPEWAVPILGGILAAVDKAIREFKK